jgi:hypothetical protein
MLVTLLIIQINNKLIFSSSSQNKIIKYLNPIIHYFNSSIAYIKPYKRAYLSIPSEGSRSGSFLVAFLVNFTNSGAE